MVSPDHEEMVRAVEGCVAALEGVRVEVDAGGTTVAAAERLVGRGAAESAIATEHEEVVVDGVVVDYHHSWRPRPG